MGFQTYTCAICGASVTKRTSLFVEGKGRICRTHDELKKIQNDIKMDRLAGIALHVAELWGGENKYKPQNDEDSIPVHDLVEYTNQIIDKFLLATTPEMLAHVSSDNLKTALKIQEEITFLREYDCVNLNTMQLDEEAENTKILLGLIQTAIKTLAQDMMFEWGYKLKQQKAEEKKAKPNKPAKARKPRRTTEDAAENYKFKAKRGAKEAPRKQPKQSK